MIDAIRRIYDSCSPFTFEHTKYTRIPQDRHLCLNYDSLTVELSIRHSSRSTGASRLHTRLYNERKLRTHAEYNIVWEC